MTNRIYCIQTNATLTGGNATKPRLVRASHPSHALRHVAADSFKVRVATQDDLVNGLAAGTKVEDIKAEQAELPTT